MAGAAPDVSPSGRSTTRSRADHQGVTQLTHTRQKNGPGLVCRGRRIDQSARVKLSRPIVIILRLADAGLQLLDPIDFDFCALLVGACGDDPNARTNGQFVQRIAVR